VWCSQYYRKSDLFEDDLAEFDHSREADAPPCPPHPQTSACFCVGTAAARARAAQPLLYSAAQPHCAREVTARARSRIAHARTHARTRARLSADRDRAYRRVQGVRNARLHRVGHARCRSCGARRQLRAHAWGPVALRVSQCRTAHSSSRRADQSVRIQRSCAIPGRSGWSQGESYCSGHRDPHGASSSRLGSGRFVTRPKSSLRTMRAEQKTLKSQQIERRPIRQRARER
jgi:hypothetical protein